MSQNPPVILVPEADDPTVQTLMQDAAVHDIETQLGVSIRFGRDGQPESLSEAAAELNTGTVDVVVTGAAHSSSDVIRTAIKEINRISPNPEHHRQFVSSFFVMEKAGQEPLVLADCAVNVKPNPEQLAQIASDTTKSFMQIFPQRKPVVAFLSFSTFGSANTEEVTQVQEAVALFKKAHPDITAYGEIQLDAATNKRIFEKKAAAAGIELVDGQLPNILILPDGQSGNLVYKAFEQLGGYDAAGPMLNGIAKDIHDLSRGVSPQGLLRSLYYAGVLHLARAAERQE